MNTFTGTGVLVRMALRRDRVTVPVTVGLLVLLMYSAATAMTHAYADEASRAALSTMMTVNPAFAMILGPLTSTSVGAAVTWRVGLILTLILALTAAATVVRHSRKEEELNRTELVRAAVVGAAAPLTAAMVVAALLVVATVGGVVVVVGTIGEGFTAESAGATALVGAQYLGVGLAAIGLAAITSQLTATARGASALNAGVLVLGYVLRGLGDVQNDLSWLRWVGPSGWVELVDPYGEQRFTPLVLMVAVAATGITLALLTVRRRDLGAALLRTRVGADTAPNLRSAAALLTRLHRPPLLIWVGAVGAYGLLTGLVMNSAADMVGTSPQLQAILAAAGGADSMNDLMLSMTTWLSGLATGAWAISTMNTRLQDETAGRLALLLATKQSRTRYLTATAGLLFLGGVLIPVTFALALGAGRLLNNPDADTVTVITTMLAAGGVQIPAVLVVAGTAVALYGWAPTWGMWSWALIVWGFLADLLAALLDLPGWVVNLSVYSHVPAVPLEDATATPLVIMTAVGVGLWVAGLAGFRRRDLLV